MRIRIPAPGVRVVAVAGDFRGFAGRVEDVRMRRDGGWSPRAFFFTACVRWDEDLGSTARTDWGEPYDALSPESVRAVDPSAPHIEIEIPE
jgi:hypothetical protein